MSDRSSRRRFLRQSFAASLAALVAPRSIQAFVREECDPSTADIQGPFYLANAPLRTVLAANDEPGKRLILRGRALANDCVTPVSNVTIDLWAANAEGCYSGFEGCATERGSMNLRGRAITNQMGEYEFETVFPGKYLNGSQYRPAHLHVKVRAAGMNELTTQLYFEGDTSIPSDPWASLPTADQRILPLQDGTSWRAEWNVILPLQSSAVSSEGISIDRFKLHHAQPNPMRTATELAYDVPRSGLVVLVITDLNGKIIRHLVEAVHAPGRYVERWDGRDNAGFNASPGAYHCTLSSLGLQESVKIILER